MKLTIGQRIKMARIRHNLTQAQLAERIPLSKTALSEIESGVTDNPRMDTLIVLADALQTSIDYLAGRTEQDTERKDADTVPVGA
jgi:transcriptional regulator with XRE-family HTH domain